MRKYTMVGGYPVAYLDESETVLCAECCEDLKEEDETVKFNDFVNWENDCLNCDECSKLIESAYGEVD